MTKDIFDLEHSIADRKSATSFLKIIDADVPKLLSSESPGTTRAQAARRREAASWRWPPPRGLTATRLPGCRSGSQRLRMADVSKDRARRRFSSGVSSALLAVAAAAAAAGRCCQPRLPEDAIASTKTAGHSEMTWPSHIWEQQVSANWLKAPCLSLTTLTQLEHTGDRKRPARVVVEDRAPA